MQGKDSLLKDSCRKYRGSPTKVVIKNNAIMNFDEPLNIADTKPSQIISIYDDIKTSTHKLYFGNFTYTKF